MRNFKRTLALVLAVIMIVGTFATVSAAPAVSVWYDNAVAKLDSLGITNIGTTADQLVTRNEFVMWIAKIESGQTSEDAWKDEIASVNFSDVKDGHYKAAIAYAHKADFIRGDGDGTFRPEDPIKLYEASAVVVRLMRYESKVNTSEAAGLDMRYMSVASMYCNAFDNTFYSKTNTYNPDFLLTKGAAAYILYTIMNFDNPAQLRLTADGIDLGARFAGSTPVSVAKDEVYYVANIDRQVYAVSNQKYYIGNIVNGVGAPTIYYNKIDELSTVTLLSADGLKRIDIPAKEFLKLVRVNFGLAPTPDFMNEEPEIDLFNYVDAAGNKVVINNGTLVNVKLDPEQFVSGVATITDYTVVKNFGINANCVVVDTMLRMQGRGNAYKDYLGWSLDSISTASQTTPWKPVLSSSYDATMATSWTNKVYGDVIVTPDDPSTPDVNEEVKVNKIIAATLNFKGITYKYGTDIVAYDATWNAMDVDTAVNTLINAAQGECYAVFNDTDADGKYETVYVRESYAFAYADKANVEPKSSTIVNAMTSISNGAIAYPNVDVKGNTIGSVIYNKTVGYPNNGNIASSDSYNLTAASTGKLQLILVASNQRPIQQQNNQQNCVPLYYTVADLAAFYTGTIQEVFVSAVEGYYEANILCTDGAIRKVYIPTEATDAVSLDVSIGGATAEYTFNAKEWFTFLEATKNAAVSGGIFQTANVKDPEYLNWASAWMAGKAVEFAIDENNEVICILGTDAATGTVGFVAGVEKTETGNNTYNVTLAVSQKVEYASSTKYFHKTNNPVNTAELKAHLQNASVGNNLKITAETKVGLDGVTYYKTSLAAGSRPLYASTPTMTADTYYVFLQNGNTVVNPFDSEGYFLMFNGQRWVDEFTMDTYNSVGSVVTKEVRASASGMFDWANYHVYNQLFEKGTLLDPAAPSDAKVDAGRDLIYVKLMKDGSSLNYILYTATPATLVSSKVNEKASGNSYETTGSYSGRIWKLKHSNVRTQEGSWYGIEEGYFLSLDEVAGTRVPTYDAYGTENGYTALYNAKVGFEPYYQRTWNATTKAYEYEIRFTKVVTYTNIPGEADALVDRTNTLMIPLYKGQTGVASVQVVATTDADRALYTIDNGYYIDDDNKVFVLLVDPKFQSVHVEYQKDKNGILICDDVKFDLANAANQTEELDVAFTDTARLGTDKALNTYATLKVTEKPRTADGWYPGALYLNVDGTDYNISSSTKIVVVTPSADGFAIEVKNVTDFASTGLFVTEWNAVIGSGNTIQTIAVVGQKPGKITADPVTPPATEEEKTTLVFLDGTAKAYVKQDLYSKDYLVISDKTAYALPSGEEVGAIYRRYTTYADANNSITIDLGIEGGKWYVINEKNEIVSEKPVEFLTGTVTSTSIDGTTIATMDGEKNVVISNMKTEFFYFNAEKTVLNVAGDNTKVTIISKDAFDKLFTSYETAIQTAQEALDAATEKYNAGNLSQAKYEYYKAQLANAEKALVDAKAQNLDKYFNGQFWGVPNSALYTNFATAQGVFQEGKPTLTFSYVIVEDTLCVFSDSFSFGA